MTSPLEFPSADGPGRNAAASTDSEAPRNESSQRPWALAPTLGMAFCALALLSIALHDGLGLRAADRAVADTGRERAERALQALEARLKEDAEAARQEAFLLARTAAASESARDEGERASIVEQIRRRSGADRVEFLAGAAPGAALSDGAQTRAGAALVRDADGEAAIRFAEPVGPARQRLGWLSVERRLPLAMARDLATVLGAPIQIYDAHGPWMATAPGLESCVTGDQLAGLLAQRATPATAAPQRPDCVVRAASVAGLRVVLTAWLVPDDAASGMGDVHRQFAWIAALTLAVAGLAGLLLARRLAAPLRVLAARAEDIAVRYTGHALERSPNETLQLRAAVEAMTAALMAQFERLRGMHLDEMQNSLELQRRYALMRLLRELSTAVHGSQTLGQALQQALEELGAYLDWPIGRVLVLDGRREGAPALRRSIWFVGDRKRFARFIEESEALSPDSAAQGLIGRARATGMPHWITDLARLESWDRRAAAVQCGLRSGFVIPVPAGEQVSAYVEFFADHRVEASAEMLELIEAIHTELWQAGERHRDEGMALDVDLEPDSNPREPDTPRAAAWQAAR